MNRLVVTLTISSIIVLAAGNITGKYAYLRLDGRITYPVMTPLGQLASDVMFPGRLAVRKFIDLRRGYAARMEHDPDRQQIYSALVLYGLTVAASIAAYAGLLHLLLACASVLRGRLAGPLVTAK
jgi:hypothetical protein